MECQKIINLLDTTSDNVTRFIIKNELRFMINLKDHTILTSKKDLKHQC